jgi:hypothetical protein
MKRLIFIASACLLLVGCSALYVKAPADRNIILLANEPTTVRLELRQVSWFWGLIPLSNEPLNIATWAQQINLGQLRVKSYYKWYEYLWNIPGFLLLGLHTNTVLLEGNPL